MLNRRAYAQTHASWLNGLQPVDRTPVVVPAWVLAWQRRRTQLCVPGSGYLTGQRP